MDNKKLLFYISHLNSRDSEWHTLIPVSKNLVVVQTSKCACTTMARLCCKYNKIIFNGDIHEACYNYKRHIKLENEKVFQIYKDPVKRFISFYVDKCVNNSGGSAWVVYKNLINKSIDEVLDAVQYSLLNDKPYYQDQHIRKQIYSYIYEDVDVIVPIQLLDDFLKNNNIEPIVHENKTNSNDYTITKEQEERIKLLYKEDYNLLNSDKIYKL